VSHLLLWGSGLRHHSYFWLTDTHTHTHTTQDYVDESVSRCKDSASDNRTYKAKGQIPMPVARFEPAISETRQSRRPRPSSQNARPPGRHKHDLLKWLTACIHFGWDICPSVSMYHTAHGGPKWPYSIQVVCKRRNQLLHVHLRSTHDHCME
jgi:hypothetical protein